jgi:hypothetical protein
MSSKRSIDDSSPIPTHAQIARAAKRLGGPLVPIRLETTPPLQAPSHSPSSRSTSVRVHQARPSRPSSTTSRVGPRRPQSGHSAFVVPARRSSLLPSCMLRTWRSHATCTITCTGMSSRCLYSTCGLAKSSIVNIFGGMPSYVSSRPCSSVESKSLVPSRHFSLPVTRVLIVPSACPQRKW